MSNSEAGTSGAVMEDFDVFLNHCWPHDKFGFVNRLEDALRCAGFRPFLDTHSLMNGNPKLKSIDQALDIAKVHVAVVTSAYAESNYCLDELVAMMRSGKPVIPVFYDVEPVHLRWVENGPFAEAFEEHKLKAETQKVQEWRDALGALAGITRFCMADHKFDEVKLKQSVVDEVARYTHSNYPHNPVKVEKYRVGLEGATNSCIQVLENMGNGVGLLTLVGMGGVGKSVLAREIYNHYVTTKKFRCMTFLAIRRDPPSSNVESRPPWFGKLRGQLLWDLLRVQWDLLRVQGISSNYSSWFHKLSTLWPVFIVIEDVHDLDQFEALIPRNSFLYPGSRIIITSRDRNISKIVAGRMGIDQGHGVCVYDVGTLDFNESNLLFNLHAFHAKEAPQEFKDLAEDVVKACGGLPLALKVIGSSLSEKTLDGDKETIWLEARGALRQSHDVMGVLRWSYDNLQESEKLMFLDITCLFYDRSVKEAFAYWEDRKRSAVSHGGVCIPYITLPHTTLRNLINKNLVFLDASSTSFKVHVLMKDLGRMISRTERNAFVNSRYFSNDRST
ncbi:hypothetical protein M758_3G099300, partial [Ceratodon purpureus]